MSFLGTYSPRLDDKGRLALPAKFRPELEGGLVICKGQEHCLYVFPAAQFAAFTQAVANAPITDARARNYGRILFGSASNETPDGQGRIMISPMLRGYAGLTKDCVVMGVNNRLEIWDAATHAAWSEQADQAFAEIAEEVMPGMF